VAVKTQSEQGGQWVFRAEGMADVCSFYARHPVASGVVSSDSASNCLYEPIHVHILTTHHFTLT